MYAEWRRAPGDERESQGLREKNTISQRKRNLRERVQKRRECSKMALWTEREPETWQGEEAEK